MTIDAHHHFLDPRRNAYPWIDERRRAVDRTFGIGLVLNQVADADEAVASREISDGVELLGNIDACQIDPAHDPGDPETLRGQSEHFLGLARVVERLHEDRSVDLVGGQQRREVAG